MQLFLYPLEDHPGTRLVTQNHFLAGSIGERQDNDPAATLMRHREERKEEEEEDVTWDLEPGKYSPGQRPRAC